MKSKRISSGLILLAVVIGVLIGEIISEYKNNSNESGSPLHIYYHKSVFPRISQRYVEMKLPAVYEANTTGAYALARMYITPGHGDIFIHINNVLYGESTEQSIRKAIRYALQHENISEEAYNFYVSLDSEASILTGPSAGAAFTLMALALLENKSINQSVMITGTIMKDGRIGLSGKIKEKAKAAKDVGAQLFLVPYGLGKEYNIEQKEECDIWSGKEYCDVGEYANITSIEELVGIKVIEVKTIDEAAKYVLS